MKIEKMAIEEVIPYENNAKLHPQEQIEQIKKSIEEFGNNDPIAIDKNNVVIEGHGRLLALKELGYKEVEVIKLGHLTEEQRKAYTLIHNKLTMNTDFDLEILELELGQIENIDMSDYDFSFDVNIEDFQEPEIEEDEYEVEVPEEPKAKLGDIYQLGRHRLMCGDSTKEKDVDLLVNNASIDLVATDPPYNVDYGSKAEAVNKYKYKNSSRLSDRNIKNDFMPQEQFQEFLYKAFANFKKHLKMGGAFYIFYSSSNSIEFELALRMNELKSRQQLIWVKNVFVFGRQDYQWKHEPCLYGWKEGTAHYFVDDRTQATVIEDEKPDIKKMKKDELIKLVEDMYSDRVSTTIIREDKPARSEEHPTMKPIKLMARLIKNSSKKDENVLDLFGGSGSTLITCEQLGRNCLTMEYDPKYVDVIINRWETLTGEKAVKIS